MNVLNFAYLRRKPWLSQGRFQRASGLDFLLPLRYPSISLNQIITKCLQWAGFPLCLACKHG